MFLFLGAISYPADTFNNVVNDDVVGRKAAVAGLLGRERDADGVGLAPCLYRDATPLHSGTKKKFLKGFQKRCLLGIKYTR